MGCIASKNTVSVTPAFDHSGSLREQCGMLGSSQRSRSKHSDASKRSRERGLGESTDSGTVSSIGTGSLSFRLSNFHKYIEGEQVAAGWPAWLSAVAGEAIQGWVPLKADSYEKLEKIGQGTYSTVFRARDLDTGNIVALKKVRFDNFEPESVRFMAREIQILRKLNHPNIVKLDGLITSRLSCNIYLVFEYMEHDLAGLLSCPDISFTESQVKCYMYQLMSGIEHCHSRGVMHRDIKCSNLLVSNEGVLKIADFGLANFSNPEKKPLTSRVVTLWYRPPELLLGSTDYVSSVDLWSVGCVFAEVLIGKPILQGRTEVEQLHKIFKLCGSPAEEYWKKSKLPHATMFKPQHPYDSSLREMCKELPEEAVGLIETLLSVEPYKRGTASSALKSEYFRAKPHACDPSSLPKYPPNKEIDAKIREDHRRRAAGRVRGAEAACRLSKAYKPTREVNGFTRLTSFDKEPFANRKLENGGLKLNRQNNDNDGSRFLSDLQPKPDTNPSEESLRVNCSTTREDPFSGPMEVRSSSGFAWAKKRKDDFTVTKLNGRSSSTSLSTITMDTDTACTKNPDQNTVAPNVVEAPLEGKKPLENTKHAMIKQWTRLRRPDSFDVSKPHHSREISDGFYMQLNGEMSNKCTLGFEDSEDKVEFSGPLLSQSHKVDELLEKHERHIRQEIRRKSWFQRVRKPGK